MIIPQFLKAGDTVAIVASARKVKHDDISAATHLLESWGLKVKVGKSIGLSLHQLAGTAEERAKDFNTQLADKNVRAILCAKGGFGTLQMIDMIDFSLLEADPKWLCGYSDITAIHAHLNNKLGMASIHSVMATKLSLEDSNSQETAESLRKMLFGLFDSYFLKQKNTLNRTGQATGILKGGNMSILHSISGSVSDDSKRYEDCILFLEEIDEYLYHVDRMMTALKRAGKLDKLSAILCGYMTDMNDHEISFGENAEEIISRHVNSFNYPLVFGFPSGHDDLNLALMLGANHLLEVEPNSIRLKLLE